MQIKNGTDFLHFRKFCDTYDKTQIYGIYEVRFVNLKKDIYLHE